MVTVPGLDSIVTLRTLELCQLFKLLGIIIQERHMVGRESRVWMMVNPCQNVSFSDKWLFDWKKKLLSQSNVFRIIYVDNSLFQGSYTADKAELAGYCTGDKSIPVYIGTAAILHTDLQSLPTNHSVLWLLFYWYTADTLCTTSKYNI